MSKPTLLKLFGLFCVFFLFAKNIDAGVIYEQEFRGEEQEMGVLLSWSTILEENNSLFIIERASDGSKYESVGAVGGSGDSEKLTEYTFLDFDASGAYVLYRLQQIDEDGTISYSGPLFINKVIENQFTVAKMSNMMATDNFEVTFDMMIDANMEYHLTDAKGETIIREVMEVQKGINDLIIDIADLSAGTYKLMLRVDEEIETLTFKKVRSTAQKNPGITAKNK